MKKKAVTKHVRTDFFEKHIVAIWREIQRPVPYAFRTADGTPRSLDAGCLGFLLNRTDPELISYNDAKTGELIAVKPTGRLTNRYVDIEDRLRDQIRFKAEASQKITNYEAVDGLNYPTPIEEHLELDFNLDAPPDERRINLSKLVIREGAAIFRKEQMKRWSGKCVATGCAVSPALDAAHIFRYLGRHTNRADNGLILRSDVHKLFDRGLITIQDVDHRLIWRVSRSLENSEYVELEGRELLCKRPFMLNREIVNRQFREFKR